MKTITAAALFAVLLACAASAAEGWVPVRVTTRDGSRLMALLKDAGVSCKTGEGPAEKLSWSALRALKLSERVDPKLDADARAAVKDLLNDVYQVRAKAEERLRGLGWAAAPALREATQAADAEVSTKARMLLAEMAAKGNDDGGDAIEKADGTKFSGRVELETLDLRTGWGPLVLPASTLERIEVLAAAEAAALAQSLGPAVEGAKATVGVAPPPEPPGSGAKRYGPEDADLDAIIQGREGPPNLLAGLTLCGFEKGADRKTQPKANDPVEDLYAAWGALLRPEAGRGRSRIVADDAEPVAGMTPGMSAMADAEDGRGRAGIEITFVQRGSYDPKTRTGRPGGVHIAGVSIGAAEEGQLGLEAYDVHGRLLLRVLNRKSGDPAQGRQLADFLGVSSSVPIVRLRVYRVVPGGPALLRIDDLAFDRVGPADRDERYCAAETLRGDRLIGHPAPVPGGAKDRVAVRPLFLAQGDPAWEIPLAGLTRWEPGVPDLLEQALAVKPGEGEEKEPRRVRRIGPPQDVLLQNGEAFRAHLVKLDKDEVVFDLAGGAELKLPRGVLRKIDLYPEAEVPGEAPAPLSVAADEKPGVEFKKKMVARNDAAPQPEPEKKDPEHNPAAGMPRMDNAEILGANAETNELVVDPKDGGGAWPIDLATARYLVFPPAAAAGGGEKHEWLLTLRQGSRFAVSVVAIGEKDVTASFAGGTIVLPGRVVDALARKRPQE
ncbi:MAG: hypothetical protein KIS92_02300 [Planctomycetota bacterium]|nr:hypothetical protein [Planctomycetota bacterium]